MLVREHVELLRPVGDDVTQPLVGAQVAVLYLVEDDLQYDDVLDGGIFQEVYLVQDDVRVWHEVVRVRADVGLDQRGAGERGVVLMAGGAALYAAPHIIPQVVFPHHLDNGALLGFLQKSFGRQHIVPDGHVIGRSVLIRRG